MYVPKTFTVHGLKTKDIGHHSDSRNTIRVQPKNYLKYVNLQTLLSYAQKTESKNAFNVVFENI